MKLSMVMPVYNEEELLPRHLDLAHDFFDEIIIINGSPYGPSTDKTKAIAKGYKNVKLLEGKFELSGYKEGWDKIHQIRTGLERTTGDFILITSCDCIYSSYEKLRKIIEDHQDYKIIYTPTIDFFLDTSHVRMPVLYEQVLPIPIIEYPIFSRKIYNPNGNIFWDKSKIVEFEYVYTFDLVKFHYGWVTGCDKQVKKHIRNLNSGLWGEYGTNIALGGDKVKEAWAIGHVFHYAREACYPLCISTPHPLNDITFSYLDNVNDVLLKFKQKYHSDFYDNVI